MRFEEVVKATKDANGAMFVIVSEHQTKLNKKNKEGKTLLEALDINPEDVKYKSVMEAKVGISYKDLLKENNVEREVNPLSWGKFVIDGIIIEHKGEYYLRAYPEKEEKVNLHTLSYDELSGFLPASKKKKESNEPEIKVRAINIKNILSIDKKVL